MAENKFGIDTVHNKIQYLKLFSFSQFWVFPSFCSSICRNHTLLSLLHHQWWCLIKGSYSKPLVFAYELQKTDLRTKHSIFSRSGIKKKSLTGKIHKIWNSIILEKYFIWRTTLRCILYFLVLRTSASLTSFPSCKPDTDPGLIFEFYTFNQLKK